MVPNRPEDSALTFRQVVRWVAQIACKYAKINNSGELILQWYDTALLELSSAEMQEEDSVVKIDTVKSGSIETDDVVITGIRVVEEDTSENTAGAETAYQYGIDGYVLEITGNRLIQGGSGEQVAEFLGKKLNGIQFRPLNITCQSDPSIETGDIGLVTDYKGNMYKTIITGLRYNGGGTQTLTSSAEKPSRLSAVRYSEATKLYKEFRNGLRKSKTDWEKIAEELKKAMNTSAGLYSVIQEHADGSKTYYLCDHTTLEASQVIFELNDKGWAVSSDGGQSWNAGLLVDGTMITKILNTVGLNADWINTGTFIVKDNRGNVVFRVDTATGRVDIKATTFSLVGKTIEEITADKLNQFIDNVYTPEIIALQSQVDGQIETFYYDHEPTLENVPASEWETDEEKQKHIGDLFYWKSKGFSYRFFQDGATWKWQLVKDTDVTKALADAAEAQDTADAKRRTFVSTPIPPYDVGDLWMQGAEGDILTCSVARGIGSVFVSADWVKLNKYTDDTVARQALNSFTQEKIFNALTNNGITQGIFLQDGKIYINGEFIKSLVIKAENIDVEDLSSIGATIGGWVIKDNCIQSQNGKVTLYPTGEIDLSDPQTGYQMSISIAGILGGNAEFTDLHCQGSVNFSKFAANSSMLRMNVGGYEDLFELHGKSSFYQPPKIYNLTHVTSGGHLVFASDGATLAYLASSSKRYKAHVRELVEKDVEKLFDIPVVLAKYKKNYLASDDPLYDKAIPMFYAEDIEKVFPEAASYKNGILEDWNYRVLIPAMEKQIQIIRKENLELKRKIKCLEEIVGRKNDHSSIL